MSGFEGGLGLGAVEVRATSGRGFSAEELSEQAMKKIMAVSDQAPEPIRAQAKAYHDRIRAVLAIYLRQAKRSGITDIYNILRDHGQHDAAEIVRRLAREQC